MTLVQVSEADWQAPWLGQTRILIRLGLHDSALPGCLVLLGLTVKTRSVHDRESGCDAGYSLGEVDG